MGNSPVSVPHPYSYEVPDSAVKGQAGPVYRNPGHVKDLLSEVLGDKSLRTSYDIFKRAAETYPDRQCHGKRPIDADGKAGPFEWQTYKQVHERVVNFGKGLRALELIPEVDNMRMLGLYMKNRSEWIVGEQGAFSQRVTTVPLYDTLGEETVQYVLNQTSLKTVVCTTLELPKLINCKKDCPAFTTAICSDFPCPADLAKQCEEAGIQLLNFDEVEAKGAASEFETLTGESGDIGTFCYTSGTTGEPKGAILTQANLLGNIAGFVDFFLIDSPILKFNETPEVYLSYLPLAHVMERLIQTMLYHFGACIGFYQGDPLKIMEDIGTLRPTVFVSVPRLLNRLHDKVTGGAKAAGGLKATLFDKAVASKTAALSKGYLKHAMWDRLVFDKVKARVGLDRVKIVATGSAPIAGHVMDFLRIFFGCPVIEGYGQTEVTCVASFTHPHDFVAGHVGQPAACTEIKLVDVPEMNYVSTDTEHGSGDAKIACKGRGEICFRGPCSLKEYYKMPDKTAEAMDAEGWVHSGDIGLWMESGQLKIVDRKKNIFKLSQGEYVAPEKIENVMVQSPYVAQSFVYGNSFHSCLVAIVVPDFENLVKIEGIPADKTHAELCLDETVKKAVLASMKEYGTKNKLRGFEMVKALHLITEPFSVENDILTPSFKLKRNVALQVFEKEVDQLYNGLGDKVAGKDGLKQKN